MATIAPTLTHHLAATRFPTRIDWLDSQQSFNFGQMCSYMALNTMEKLNHSLETLTPQIELPEELRLRAVRPLTRMLEMSRRVTPGVTCTFNCYAVGGHLLATIDLMYTES